MTQMDLQIIRNERNCIVCEAATADNLKWRGIIKVLLGDYFAADLFISSPNYTSSDEAVEAMSSIVKEVRSSK